MKKPSVIQLSIPQPCTQAWEEMHPVAGGRHCSSCEKAVTDFSRMTDAQLLKYFKTFNGTGCGRFRTEQLDRVIQTVEARRSTWWARVAAGMFLILGLSKTAEGQKKLDSIESKKQPNEQRGAHSTGDHIVDEPSRIRIQGVVRDEKGNPIVNAEVILFLHGQKETIVRALTDFDGMYNMLVIEKYDYKLRYDILFRYSGLERVYTEIPATDEIITVNARINLADKEVPADKISTVYQRPIIDPNFTNSSGQELNMMGLYIRMEPSRLDLPNPLPFEIKRVYGDILPVGR